MRVATTPPPEGTLYVRKLYDAVGRCGVEVETLTIRRLLLERFDIVHLHWPEWQLRITPLPRMLVRAAALLCALWWARWRGARLIWTVHNVDPHEATPHRITVLYFAVLTRLVDGVVSPSGSGVSRLREAFPALRRRPTAVIPIGHLRDEYPPTRGRAHARSALGVGPEVGLALFFGLIRPYKGVEALASVFARIDRPDVALLLAGRPIETSSAVALRRAGEADPRLQLRLEHVPDGDVGDLLLAADLVVLPYTQSTNSFVALLALSYERPILAPALGAFPELARRFGTDWVRLYDGELGEKDLAEALADVGRPRSRPPDLDGLDWGRIASTTVAFYGRVRSASA